MAHAGFLKDCQDTLEEVILLDPDANLGSNKLPNYTALRKVTLPEGYPVIASNAFQGCSALTEINLPDSLTGIGRYAFSGCPIASVTVPAGVSAIDYVFEYNTALTSVTVPNSVQTMEGAFRGCTALKSVNMPWEEGSVSSLRYAFQDCNSLESIWISPYVTDLTNAFSGCAALSNFMPSEEGDAITAMENAFEGCSSLTGIWLPEGKFTFLSSGMFRNSGLREIEIPNGVTAIYQDAFCGCGELHSVLLPQTLESIGRYAFANCGALGVLDVPDSVLSLSSDAFENDRIDLITTQGKPAWNVAMQSDEDEIRAAFRDQIEFPSGAQTGMKVDGNTITLTAPEVAPNGNYRYTYFLKAADGSDFQTQTGENRLSASFSGLHPDAMAYIGWVGVGFDFSSIDTATGDVRPGYNGAVSKRVSYPFVAVNEQGEIQFLSEMDSVAYLPQSLISLDSEAFADAGLSGCFIVCPPGVKRLDDSIFAHSGIRAVYLPESVESMGNDVFDGCSVVIYCVSGSWAEEWATGQGLPLVALEK